MCSSSFKLFSLVPIDDIPHDFTMYLKRWPWSKCKLLSLPKQKRFTVHRTSASLVHKYNMQKDKQVQSISSQEAKRGRRLKFWPSPRQIPTRRANERVPIGCVNYIKAASVDVDGNGSAQRGLHTQNRWTVKAKAPIVVHLNIEVGDELRNFLCVLLLIFWWHFHLA